MTHQDRCEALSDLLGDEDPQEAREKLRTAVVRSSRFRRETVRGWTDERLAQWGARAEPLEPGVAWPAIAALHLHRRVPMLSDFLDAAGIAHENGHFANDGVTGEPVPVATFAAAADLIRGRYSLDEVVLYLLALRVNFASAFPSVDEWMAQLHASSEGEHNEPEAFEAAPAEEGIELAPTPSPGLTRLDRLVIAAVVDAAAGVDGAGIEEDVDDIILEMEQLNGRRHQTFFHSGFRDSLFARDPAGTLKAENESRRQWYWAGYVSGLARRRLSAEIVKCFDADRAVGALGGTGEGFSIAAANLVFSALVDAGRVGEAAAFAKTPATAASGKLRVAMLDTATKLIRESRAHEARPLLDTLASVLPESVEDIEGAELAFYIEVKRRRALCLRQVGEAQQALTILRHLITIPEAKAGPAVQTDIGMIYAGFNRLGDIVLPPDHANLSILVNNLARGEADFSAAAASKAYAPAHANYALGVLAMARHQYAEAAHRLESAYSYFGRNPEIYSTDGTLGLTQLYLGVSLCCSLEDFGRLPQARELINAGLSAGAKLPVWLVRSTVDALALSREDLAVSTAADLVSRCGEEVLDELVSSAGGSAQAVRLALFSRAARPSRSDAARVADYRAVLPKLIASQEIEKACDALEFLEEKAHAGIQRREFTDMLEDPTSLSPAWDPDRVSEAKIRLLEVDGRYTEAGAEVLQIIRKLLASGGPADLDNAELLLDALEDYGPHGAGYLEEVRGVIEARVARREQEACVAAPNGDQRCDVKILIVGGNEVQARMDADIKAKVCERMPGVSLEFIHSGWTSNWAQYVERFKTASAHADGVVFLQLMRTTFGRTVRANCHLPWRGCRGRGQGEIINAIARVLPAARERTRAMAGAVAR